MQPTDIGILRQAEDPRVSPDGRRIAFVVANVDLEENRYCRRLYVREGGDEGALIPFTGGPDDSLPRWSPDGSRIAFVRSSEESACEICVLPVDRGGERVAVAELACTPSELEWSPDGSRLALVARDPDPDRYGAPGKRRAEKDMSPRRLTHLFFRLNGEDWTADRPNRLMVLPADGSTSPLVLTPGPFEASDLAWSPDGSRLAFVSGRHDTWDLDRAVDIWTVSADGMEEPEKLTETVAEYSKLAWSPDGARLAFLVDETPLDSPRHQRLGLIELASHERKIVSSGLDRNCGPYPYSRSPVFEGDRLLVSVEDSGSIHVYSFSAEGDRAPEVVVGGERWVSAWDAAGGTIAFVAGSPSTLPELVVSSFGGEIAERRLTNLSKVLDSIKLSQPMSFVASSADGTEVPCFAMPPVNREPGRRYPTLLNIHGGPFTSYGHRFFDEFQLQAGAGFGVLYCNPRGSSGYSEAWGRAVRWPEAESDPGSGWGGVDYEDVMACAREGASRFDWVDHERMGVLGGSYGGYMTSWIIGHTDTFKAACSERACNNLLMLEYQSDIASVFRGYVGRTHLEAPAAYLRQSPVSHVQEMRTPLLILHSEDDLRCPISQAEELFVALRLLGREPTFVRFPGENHELSRSGAPRHRVARAEMILDWFRRNLSP